MPGATTVLLFAPQTGGNGRQPHTSSSQRRQESSAKKKRTQPQPKTVAVQARTRREEGFILNHLLGFRIAAKQPPLVHIYVRVALCSQTTADEVGGGCLDVLLGDDAAAVVPARVSVRGACVRVCVLTRI